MNLNEARSMAETLIKKHCPNCLFKFDNAKVRFGKCNYLENTISLSKPLVELNKIEVVKDTILHEIAHALTRWDHHGKNWQRTAISIGCNGQRCYDNKDVIAPPQKYVGTCPKCGHKTKRSRLTARAKRISCGKCSKVFDKERLFVWELNQE